MNSISDAHAIKRVNDFRMANYEVKVFGFLREDESCTKTDATIIGTFSNALKYRQRNYSQSIQTMASYGFI